MYIIKQMQETYVLHLKGEDKNEYRFEYFFFLYAQWTNTLAHCRNLLYQHHDDSHS